MNILRYSNLLTCHHLRCLNYFTILGNIGSHNRLCILRIVIILLCHMLLGVLNLRYTWWIALLIVREWIVLMHLLFNWVDLRFWKLMALTCYRYKIRLTGHSSSKLKVLRVRGNRLNICCSWWHWSCYVHGTLICLNKHCILSLRWWWILNSCSHLRTILALHIPYDSLLSIRSLPVNWW